MDAAPLFANPAPADLPGRPTLMVVVDTEEEFDWDAPVSRQATSVTAMRHIERTQTLCGAVGLVPTYVIDYPIATQPAGYDMIRSWAKEGRCDIGAHLHPWVNPPFDEQLNGRNTYLCNLPASLQRAKMRQLHQAIVQNVGVVPRVFKAGRYGIGRDGLAVFDELGLVVDASVNPCMDFTADGGPDFSYFDARPFWIDQQQHVVEVPCTHGFVGWARGQGRWLRRAAESLPGLPGPGILSRLGAVNRVMLSPEGNTLPEMIALTRALLADGLTLFSLTFHSPSVVPGHTPYVRSQADLSVFLTTIERYFEFFFGELGGQPSTPERFRQDLLGRLPNRHA
jgi:hypothetical protein